MVGFTAVPMIVPTLSQQTCTRSLFPTGPSETIANGDQFHLVIQPKYTSAQDRGTLF